MIRNIFIISLLSLIGCAGLQSQTPADGDTRNQTWVYDCCNPGLESGTKEMCEMATVAKNHILIDNYGNKYKFIWSDCKIGNEPWRE